MKKTILATLIALALGASAQSWANPNNNEAYDDTVQDNTVNTNAEGGSSSASEGAFLNSDNSTNYADSQNDSSDNRADNSDNRDNSTSLADSQNDNSDNRADNSTNLADSQNNNSNSDNDNSDNSDQSAGRNDNSDNSTNLTDSRNDNSNNSTNLTDSRNDNSDNSANDAYNDNSVSIQGSVINTELDAAVTDVTISPENPNTASNYIQQGAFTGAAGINMAAQNTGHASNIQQNVSVQANFAGDLNLQ